MKRYFCKTCLLLCLILFLQFPSHAASKVLDPWIINGTNYAWRSMTVNLSEEDFKDADAVYLKMFFPYSGILSLDGFNGYSSEKVSKTYNYDLDIPYELYGENRKSVDPYGKKTTFYVFGIPNNPYYTVGKGTYYVKLYNGKQTPYQIVLSSSFRFKFNDGGKSKKQSCLLKKGSTKRAVIPLGSDKKDSVWFRFYANGKKPVKIEYNLEEVSGKFEITYYGPSYPKGIKHILPDTNSYGYGGSYNNNRNVMKNGAIFETTDSTDTLARSNGKKTIGPKKGWYYIKVSKTKVKGKKDQKYRKRSIVLSMQYK